MVGIPSFSTECCRRIGRKKQWWWWQWHTTEYIYYHVIYSVYLGLEFPTEMLIVSICTRSQMVFGACFELWFIALSCTDPSAQLTISYCRLLSRRYNYIIYKMNVKKKTCSRVQTLTYIFYEYIFYRGVSPVPKSNSCCTSQTSLLLLLFFFRVRQIAK